MSNAYATHYRYGNVYWERVLNHPVANEYKYRVTIEGGWRWSFPYGGVSGLCSQYSGFVPTNTVGGGSCPPVSTVVTLVGNITPNKNVKFNGAGVASINTLPYTATVTTINQNKDLMYTSFTFDVIVPAASATNGGVVLSWTANARISQLLDGNADQAYRLEIPLDPASPATRSPRSTSLPNVMVTTGVENTILLPTVAYDNYVNEIEVAPIAKSSLFRAVPVSPSIFSVGTDGVVRFNPRANGPYAVQFLIKSYDVSVTPRVLRAEVPVDLMFESVAQNSATATLTTPTLTPAFSVGSTSSYALSATLANQGTGTWTGTINSTPLPTTGAPTFSVPLAGPGTGSIVGTMTWSPTLASASTVMCYQAVFTNGTTTVTSPGMLCVNMALAPLATEMSAPAVPLNVTVGDDITASATLKRSAIGATPAAPIIQRPVVFTLTGADGTVTTATALTDVDGLATTTALPVAAAGASTITATFNPIVNEFLLSSAQSLAFTVAKGTPVLQLPSLPALPSVGVPSPIKVRMVAQHNSKPLRNAEVSFDITSPGGQVTTVTATTDATGFATAMFTPQTLGSHTARARFGGNQNLFVAAPSGQITFDINQRVQLTLNPASAVVGGSTAVSATLLDYPQGTPVVTAGLVTFTFTGGVATQQAPVVAGTATVTATFPTQANYTATVTFTPVSPLVNSAGVQANEVATGVINVGTTATVLEPITAPAAVLLGNPLAVSTTLTRTTAPAGPIAGAPVVFTLRSGVTVLSTITGTTSATGLASVTFGAALFTARGPYTVTAAYAGGGGINPSSAPAVTVTAYQRTNLSMAATASGNAGSAIPLSAQLLTVPGGAPLVGASVTFDFGGAIPSQTVTTSTSGVASFSPIFPNGGTFTATASFLDAGGFYTNDTGSIPPVAETASSAVTVTAASTQLSALTVPSNKVVGDSGGVSVTLQRTTAPAGPVAGATVSFVLSGTTPLTVTATTNASGVATATIPLSELGTRQITAGFAGSSGLNAATPVSAPITVRQRTRLTLSPVTVYAGDVTPVTATLLALPGNTPVAGQIVSFNFFGAAPPASAVTDANGVASLNVTFAAAGTPTATASFINLVGLFVDETGNLVAETASTTVQVNQAVSALANLVVSPATGLVGNSLTVSTVLTRTSAPSGPVANNTVTFTVTGPQANPTTVTLTALTDSNGAASATVPLSARGAFTVVATYAGGSALAAVTSNTASVAVYQRAQLALAPISGTAGADVTVSARLTSVPAGAGLAGKTVSFVFGGGIGTQTATTNGNGDASVTVTFASAGSFPVTASFSDAADFYADHTGAFPAVDETASTTAAITSAATALTAPVVPAFSLVGGSLTATTTLTRTSAPVGPIPNATVTFTLDGSSPQTLTANTNSLGVASVTFTPAESGARVVTASFAATAGLNPSSATANVPVYQRTNLSVAPAVSAVAGAPVSVSAALTAVPANTPLANQLVNFDFGGAIGAQAGTTDSAGVATVTVVFPNAVPVTYTASFSNPGGFYAGSTGAVPVVAETAAGNISVAAAVTTLAQLTVAPSGLVGDSLSVSTVLTRTSAPSGTMPGATVSFTLTGPQSNPVSQTLTGITDQNGVTSVTFPLTLRGVYTVKAQYAGTSGAAASESTTASLTVYQRAQISMAPATGVAGAPTTVSATLTSVPGGTGVAGQTVTFQFVGGFSASAVTNAVGVATASVTLPSSGTFVGTASFVNLADFFVNEAGAAQPSVATESATISKAGTSLALVAPPLSTVGSTITVAVQLNRTSAPMGGVGGAPVVITLNGPVTSGATVTTNASGLAQVTFPLSVRGVYTATAAYAGDTQFDGASSNAASTAAYQKARLTLSPANGAAGSDAVIGATLTALPGSAPIANQSVVFTISGQPTPIPATTDVNGLATVSVSFAAAGTYTIDASFTNPPADFFANHDGVLQPETASGSIVITDPTPPVITATITGPQTNGWFTGDVQISWSVTDLESGVTEKIGCDPATVSTDGSVIEVTCTATSGGGTATKTETFKRDATKPVVTVPPNQTVEATSAAGGAAAYPPATAIDATSGVASTTCTPAAGAALPFGATTVSCTATDNAGNQETATFSVTVADSTAPVIDQIADVSTPATSPAGAPVSFTAPSWIDAVDGTGTTICSPVSGSTFALGTHTVTCSVTDAHQNAASRTFQVTVTNNAPTFAQPADISVPATSAAGATVSFTLSGSDIEDGPVLPAVCSPASGSTFPIAATTVSCTVTDIAGAAVTRTFTVTVTNNAPTFTAPANITTEATGAAGATATFIANGSDVEQGTIAAVCSPASGSTFAVGTTTVSCTVTDVASAAVTETFTVTVVDTTRPTVTVPANIVAEATSAAGAVVSYSGVSATDLVSPVTATCDKASNTTFALTTTTVTCSATDAAGNTGSASFTVKVQDTTAPSVTVPANIVAEATGAAGALVTYSGVSAADAVSPVTASCTKASNTVFSIATTTVTCSATDGAGNTGSSSFTVKVQDTTAPTLTLPAPIVVTATSASGATVTYATSATDVVAGSTAVSCSKASGTVFAVGTTVVSCSSTDGFANTRTGSFTVTVNPTGSVNVGPGQTVTFSGGTVGSNVNVNGGTLILTNGSSVSGNLTVTNGSLSTSNSTISGNVNFSGGGPFSIGPGTVITGQLKLENMPAGSPLSSVCGARVDKNLTLNANASPVTLGNPSASCAGNIIDGQVFITNNTAPVNVFGNTISKQMQCSANTTIAGGGNTASQKQGQCSPF